MTEAFYFLRRVVRGVLVAAVLCLSLSCRSGESRPAVRIIPFEKVLISDGSVQRDLLGETAGAGAAICLTNVTMVELPAGSTVRSSTTVECIELRVSKCLGFSGTSPV